MLATQTAQTPDTTDAYCNTCIRRAAKRLVASGLYLPSEQDDVMQDLHLALFQQAPNYDPDRSSWTTFVKTVLGYAAINLRRRRSAQRRQAPHPLSSLNVTVVDETGAQVELAATVSEDEYRARFSQACMDQTEQVALKVDVQDAVEELPEEFQEFCQLLKIYPVTEAGRRMGWSKKKLEIAMEKIRDQFFHAGLAAYT